MLLLKCCSLQEAGQADEDEDEDEDEDAENLAASA